MAASDILVMDDGFSSFPLGYKTFNNPGLLFVEVAPVVVSSSYVVKTVTSKKRGLRYLHEHCYK